MSNESELKDIREKITAIQDTNSQILSELTGLSTSFHYMKERIDSQTGEMSSLQDRVRAVEIKQSNQDLKIDGIIKGSDRVVNPIIRGLITMLISGAVVAAGFILKGS